MSAEASQLPLGSNFLPNMRPVLLLIGVAAAVALGVVVVLWTKGPTYTLLYANLSTEDASQVVQALEAGGIPYRLEAGNGAVTVPAERVHEARLKLAGQGLPQGDGGGFAMMSKDPGFGVSQFMESARYQHALETELARTISNLQPVEGARVHLAIPRQSAFVRDRRPASASVFLQLKPGRRIEPAQVTAIVNLVASSIPELESTQVTVVDQQGHLLSSPRKDDQSAVTSEQFEYARKLEETYTQRVEGLLSSVVGEGKVRAQVMADVETNIIEETREQYRPESQIVRSEQLAEEASRSGTGPQGVPGALSNQPPQPGTILPAGTPAPTGAQAAAAAAANAATANAAATAAPDNTSKQTTRNYEIDRTISHTRMPAGRIKRISVAVLVDNQRTTNDDGEVKETPLPQAQIDNLTKLVKDAVGFDQARGDSVNVVNTSFTQTAPEKIDVDAEPLWQRPIFRDLLKLGLGAIVLLVLTLMVLRPLIKGLVTPLKNQLAAPRSGPRQLEAEVLQRSPQQIQQATVNYDQQVSNARVMAGQDPARVAQVVKAWVAEDG